MSVLCSNKSNDIWIISFHKKDVIHNPSANSRCQERYSKSAREKETTQQQNENRRSSSALYPRKLLVHVIMSTFMMMLLSVGLNVGFGTLFIDIMEEYGTLRAETVVVQSLQVAIRQLTGIISGIIVTRFGPTKAGIASGIILAMGLILSYFATNITVLYFTAGALPGFGTGLLYISNTTAIGFHFTKRSRSRAFSVTSVGAGVGGFIFSYLLKYLRETYGLRETFLLVGGAALNCLPCALLLTCPASAEHTLKISPDSIQNRGKSDIKDTEEDVKYQCQYEDTKWYQMILILSKNIPYILYVIAAVCCLQTLPVFHAVFTDIYVQKGFSKTDSTLALSVMSIVSIIGRLATAGMMHIPRFSVLYVPIFCSAFGIIFLVSVNLTTSLTGTVAVTSSVGIYNGMLMTVFPMTGMALLGKVFYSTGFGLASTLCVIVGLATGPLSGFVKDVTGTYELVLYGLSALILCGFLLFCAMYWLSRRKDVSHSKLQQQTSKL